MTASTRFIVIVLAVLAFLLPAAKPVEAQVSGTVAGAACAALCVPTIDPANLATETEESFVNQVLNGIAWAAAKAVVQSMTQSIVTWINSGFEGSPAFVTNPEQFLRQVQDAVVGEVLADIFTDTGKGDRINSPYAERVGEVVAVGYYLYTSGDRLANRIRYTLNEFTQNPNAFLYGDFSQGGWRAWHAANSRCGNNVYCVQFAVNDELMRQLQKTEERIFRELDWGRGFLSWRGDCIKHAGGGGSVALNDEDKCLEHEIRTPGSVIEGQLETALGSGIRQLELADSINEIIGALASQLVQQVLGGSGLLGTTRSPSGGGRPFIEAATQGSQTTGSLTPAQLLEQLDDYETQVLTYQSNWQNIRSAALAAEAALQGCINRDGNQQTLDEVVEPVLVQATDALALADSTLAEVERIRGMLTTPGQNAAAGSAFSALVTAGPSRAEVAESVTQASSNPELGNTIFIQLTQITASACS